MNKKFEKKPSICYETGLDEAFLVGTKGELLEFAQAIIELLSGPKEQLDYLGVKTEVPKTERALTESMSEIVLDGMLVVESTEDRQALVNKILINNGEPPIDWERNGMPSPCIPTIAAPRRFAQLKHAAPAKPPDPTWPGLKWRFLARDWRYPDREVYHLKSDGHTWFDELVVGDWLHIEWMSGRRWWMQLGDAMINVTIPKGQPPVIEVERGRYYDRPSAEAEIGHLKQGDIEADPYGPDADDE